MVQKEGASKMHAMLIIFINEYEFILNKIICEPYFMTMNLLFLIILYSLWIASDITSYTSYTCLIFKYYLFSSYTLFPIV